MYSSKYPYELESHIQKLSFNHLFAKDEGENQVTIYLFGHWTDEVEG